MNSFELAFSLIRIPKLFASLLLWPMLIGIFVALGQIAISLTYFEMSNESIEQYKTRVVARKEDRQWIIQYILGMNLLPDEPVICKWIKTEKGSEIPPSNNCLIDNNEIAIQTSDIDRFDPSSYKTFFAGATAKIHICNNCTSDITITTFNDKKFASVSSARALGVYMLSDIESIDKLNEHYLAAKTERLEREEFKGTILLSTPSLNSPINISETTETMLLIINTALITIITLWLALKGHRKVLDYFARNQALLPLVAACGKSTFYNSLWIITLLRVFFFLLAVVPSTILVTIKGVPVETLNMFIGDSAQFILWIAGMIASLSALTIIASIADLKHRHSSVSFLYRYTPIFISIIGTSIYFYCIIVPSSISLLVQRIIASIPIVGTNSLILSPLLPLSATVIASHSILSGLLVVIILRINSRWFAAHLGEL